MPSKLLVSFRAYLSLFALYIQIKHVFTLAFVVSVSIETCRKVGNISSLYTYTRHRPLDTQFLRVHARERE